MPRLERRIRLSSVLRPVPLDPLLLHLDTELRGRTARKLRVELRRGTTVLLNTPRWSNPANFLEDLALDLAVGEPGIGCRTVSFRPARGRGVVESWQVVLRVFAQLGQPRWVQGPPAAVADARGFRHRLAQILSDTEDGLRCPFALLGHDVECLPVDVLDDVGEVWAAHVEARGAERRSLLLLAGSPEIGASLPGATRLELLDYGREEAVEALLEQGGSFPGRALRSLAGFTGGVPVLVDTLAERIASGRVPALHPQALLSALGPVADELRGAVDIALAHGELAERLSVLLAGEALQEDPELDRPLLAAGLVRRSRVGGGATVELRSPAIAALVA